MITYNKHENRITPHTFYLLRNPIICYVLDRDELEETEGNVYVFALDKTELQICVCNVYHDYVDRKQLDDILPQMDSFFNGEDPIDDYKGWSIRKLGRERYAFIRNALADEVMHFLQQVHSINPVERFARSVMLACRLHENELGMIHAVHASGEKEEGEHHHMPPREERAEIFQDTVEFYHKNRTLSESVLKSHAGTVLYDADDYPEIKSAKRDEDCAVRVTKNRTFEAAMKLRKEYPDDKICVLNFASAVQPGGCVKWGSGAQEESLCRCSTLFATLDRKWLWKKYYDVNRAANDVLHTDACIFSPGVVICKTDDSYPVRMDEKDWVSVDVISCAAPDLRRVPANKYNPETGEAVKLTDDEQYRIHLKRAQHIYHVAAANGEDILVLGAFGCGAFQNNPVPVAKAFHDALKDYQRYFRLVEFAVYSGKHDTSNFDAFAKEFPIVIGEPKPKNKRVVAKRSDWKTMDMPAKHATFTLHCTFSKEQIANLRFGNIPEEMEDKWFWYMEGNVLYAHRSWTGFCIFMIAVFPEGEYHEVIVNRDPEQYQSASLEDDAERLGKLLNWWSRPNYDYYHEWLSETYDALKKSGQIQDEG